MTRLAVISDIHGNLRALEAVLARRDGRLGAELFALEYDWDEAAAQARANGFPRWAEALATGAVS